MRTTVLLTSLFFACSKDATPVVATNGGPEVTVATGTVHRFGFDDMGLGTPAGFIPVLGVWQVQPDTTAPSKANVLKQVGHYENVDFPRAVVESLSFGDLKLSVSCRPDFGSIDQACGVMFRFQDSFNYYIVRANALEGNVNLYRVVGDERQIITGAAANTAGGQWHTLEVVARGNDIAVSWDDRKDLVKATDATFPGRGKIGLWTKADSVTSFDDLVAEAL